VVQREAASAFAKELAAGVKESPGWAEAFKRPIDSV
jgi:hypothetical protein